MNTDCVVNSEMLFEPDNAQALAERIRCVARKMKTENIEKICEENLSFHPAVSDVHERIKDAYMFVSSSDFEGLSNSMLEAMAMGIPTICTDCPCGGARMVIENGVNGLLTPVGDKDKLSAAMQRVADNSQIAHNIGKEAQKIRSKLSTDIIVGEWRKII